MPLVPALRRQRQADLCEASLVYRMSSRTAWATQRNPILKKQKQNKIREEITEVEPKETKHNQ